MGLAMLWIVLFHSGFSLPFPLSELKLSGYGGSDIFVFLSGFGLYYSLKKDSDPMKFYKRRLERILPSYIPFILLSFAGMIVSNLAEAKADLFITFQAFCGNFALLGRVNDLKHQTNWYMPAIIWFYIFTPIFYHLITDYKGKKKIVSIASLFAFIALVNITFFRNESVLIGVSRMFPFILGLIFADIENRDINDKLFTALAVAGVVIGTVLVQVNRKYFVPLLRDYGLDWYPFIILAPSISILAGRIFSLLDRNSVGRAINSFFKFIGANSLEIFFVHILLFTVAETLLKGRLNNALWAVISAAGIGFGIIYHYVIEFITKKFLFKKQ